MGLTDGEREVQMEAERDARETEEGLAWADELDAKVDANNALRVKLFSLARAGVFSPEQYADILAGLDLLFGVAFGVPRSAGPRRIDPVAADAFFNTETI